MKMKQLLEGHGLGFGLFKFEAEEEETFKPEYTPISNTLLKKFSFLQI